MATAALAAGPNDRDKRFYESKLVTARWFAQNRLPLIAAERAVAEATSLEVMEIDEDLFWFLTRRGSDATVSEPFGVSGTSRAADRANMQQRGGLLPSSGG